MKRLPKFISRDYVLYVVSPIALFFIAYIVVNAEWIFRPSDPLADFAVNSLQIEQASQFKELLGPYSRFGFHHPGPIVHYFFAAIFQLLFFLPHGHLQLAQLVYHAFFLWWILHLIYQWGDRRHYTFYFCGAFLLACSPLPLKEVTALFAWGPYQLLLPMALLMISSAGLATGNLKCLAPLVVAAVFIGHTHIGGLAVAAPLAVLAVLSALCLVLTRRKPVWDRPAKLSALFALVFLIVTSLPPLYEQLTAAGGGNLSKLWRFFMLGEAPPADHSWRDILPFVYYYYHSPFIFLGKILSHLGPLLILLAALGQWRPRREAPNALIVLLLVSYVLSNLAAKRINEDLMVYIMFFVYAFVAIGIFLLAIGIERLLRWTAQRIKFPTPRCALPYWASQLLLPLIVCPLVAFKFDITPQSLEIERLYCNSLISKLIETIKPEKGRVYYIWWKIGHRYNHPQWETAAGLAYRLKRMGCRVRIMPEWEFMFGEGLTCTPLPDGIEPILLSKSSKTTETIYQRQIQLFAADLYQDTMLEVGRPSLPFTIKHDSSFSHFTNWTLPQDGLRWSLGGQASIHFFTPAADRLTDQVLLTVNCFWLKTQDGWLELNGHFLGMMNSKPLEARTFSYHIPSSLLYTNNINELRFIIPEPAIPNANEQRPLGVALQKLTLAAARE